VDCVLIILAEGIGFVVTVTFLYAAIEDRDRQIGELRIQNQEMYDLGYRHGDAAHARRIR